MLPIRGATLGLLTGAYLWSGNAAAAERAYADTAELAQAPETITLGLIASGRLVQVRAMQGRLHEAASTYRQTFELATGYGMAGMPPIGVAQVGMAEVLREWNDLDGAEELARQGIARCGEWNGLAEMGLDGYLTLARLLRARGDADGSLFVLEQAEIAWREGRVPRHSERVAIERVRLWLDRGTRGLGAAVEWANAGESAWRADKELDYVGLHGSIMLARLRISQGRRGEAADVLDRALTFAEAGELTGRVIEILTLQARASLEEGNATQAMVAFARALKLAGPEGYIRAASIDTRLRMRDRHLRTADFLDVERYPTITFKSTHVEQISDDLLCVTGDLTMYGVSEEVTLDLRIDRRDREWAVMTASTTIDRRAFGVTWNRLGAIGSAVAVRFRITLRRGLSPVGAVAGEWAR